ncbi:MAG: EscU/YscU/HrcU family type III secretion system export apparatus switch protein [Acidobacteriota bacterium]
MSGEKDQKATPHRRRESRRKGQIAFSRDASSMAVFLGALLALSLGGSWMVHGLRDAFEMVIPPIESESLGPAALGEMVRRAVLSVLLLSLPLFALTFGLTLASGVLQTRFNVSFEPLMPSLTKLNPLQKIKQWVSIHGLVELAKTLGKLAAVFGLAFLVLDQVSTWVLRLGLLDASALATLYTAIAKRFLTGVAAVFAVVAVLDFVYQNWKHERDLRMSHQDIKQEYKTQEGDPLVKSQRRQIHREMSNEAVRQTVSKADVVVVNPTHYAVVVLYDRDASDAPVVTFKGLDSAARRILRLAHRVETPVVRNVPLARSLYALVPEGEEVPPDLYLALAQVLAFVHRLDREQVREQRVWELAT